MIQQEHSQTWDIFCRVIDNFGDIGVCWRLARQLANEYPFSMRLWVDEIAALQQLWPSTQLINQQQLAGVDVRIWIDSFEDITPADVIIEAFACNLPENYLKAMKQASTPPHWFNLEYLSAEDWVEGCHGLASMHPSLGLKKTFFFPGFTTKTGGLLKEKSLLDERDAFDRKGFLQSLGVNEPQAGVIVSLFGYENAAIGSLIDAWITSDKSILCLVPASKILPDINKHLGQEIAIGDEFTRGSLRLKVIPFLTQIQYDYLLWACDINFIRGEDSFVRAQWAAKPFVWHIYPQDDDVHMIKLDAFLQRYTQRLNPELKDAITQLWHNWNRGSDCTSAWNTCMANNSDWLEHSQNWCNQLDSLDDLASNMVRCC